MGCKKKRDNDIYDAIAANIKNYRKVAEITQEQLADLMFFTPEYIKQVDKTNDEYKNIQTLSITLNNVDKGIQENQKQIQTLTENNEALQLRVDTLTKNNKVKDKQIKDLKEENLSLR